MNYQIPIRALSVLLAFGMNLPGPSYSQSTGGPADSANGPTASYQIAQQTYSSVIAQLQNSGYRIVEVKRTFLGRSRILARNNVHFREVIVSRSTGEVKRDVVIQIIAEGTDGGGNGSSLGSASSSGGSGSGSSGSGSSGSSSGVNSSGGGGGLNAGASVGGGGFNAGASVGGGGVNVGVSGGGFGGGLGIGR